MLNPYPEKIRWFVNRVSAMSLPEMASRFSNLSRIRKERRKASRTRLFTPPGFSKETWSHENPLGKWFAQNEAAARVPVSYSESLSATLSTADAILKHQFEIFGKPISFGETINWLQDPITGYEWPRRFWADLDYREVNNNSGIKWLWEINRHHHIVTLAKAYFLTGAEQYAQEAINQLLSWIDQNPDQMGIHWTSSLELSTRIVNWVWALSFLETSSALTEEAFQKIVAAVCHQADHVQQHLSFYSSANNHLIGEAAGLAMAGMAFPRLPQAERWRTRGLQILTAEVVKQIYPDGSTAEQALHYLLYVMDWYFAVRHFAQLSRVDLDWIIGESLHRAAVFLRSMIDEKGQVPYIGDSDDAWVLRLDDRPEANNYLSVLATAAAWFKDPTLIVDPPGWDEKSWWLAGEEGRQTFEDLKNIPRSLNSDQSVVFPFGGYCVMQPGRTKVIFDCGPLGYLSTAAHGHADALSIWVSKEGIPVLIDSGTYAYQEGGDWRRYFRGTAAHNTLRIDGVDQSEMLGDFLWGRKARAKLIAWDSNSALDLAVAEHDGYKVSGVLHRRAVLFLKPDKIIIQDQLMGDGLHRFEQFWHCSPDARIETNGSSGTITIEKLCVHFATFGNFLDSIEILTGQENPIQGWSSAAYGRKTPAPVLVFSGKASFPASITTAFWFGNSSPLELEEAQARIITKLREVDK